MDENNTAPRTATTIGRQKENAPPPPAPDKLTSAAEKRQERIRKLETKLQRERNRFNADSRKERNSQLFAWGAMVECVYKRGTEEQRRLLREWTDAFLTEERHQIRAETDTSAWHGRMLRFEPFKYRRLLKVQGQSARAGLFLWHQIMSAVSNVYSKKQRKVPVKQDNLCVVNDATHRVHLCPACVMFWRGGYEKKLCCCSIETVKH